MQEPVRLFLQLELLDGQEAAFEQALQDVFQIVRANDIQLTYAFYRDPAKPKAVYAVETHADVQSLGPYLAVAGEALQKARACARPARVMILGNLPPDVRSRMEQDGAAVVPAWLSF